MKSLSIIYFLWLLLLVIACGNQHIDSRGLTLPPNDTDTTNNMALNNKSVAAAVSTSQQQLEVKSGNTIASRWQTPANYQRTKVSSGSFGKYLRNLPLKPSGSPVLYFDGKTIKANENIYVAVVDMELDKQDLQQCADATMRLWGEYLYTQKKYEQIHFNFLSDGKPRYYTNYAKGDYSYSNFRKYMRYIFAYANTASLRNELQPVDIMDMQIGDVFIQKGSPYGHAVIVVDMAENTTTGEKLYLLAQSYMPAQDTQILCNRNNTKLSPWYLLDEAIIKTPEWTFYPQDLRRFRQ